MSGVRQYSLRWDWGAEGLDDVDVTDGPDGLRLSGRRQGCAFRVETDAAGATVTARVEATGDAGQVQHELARGADGWRDGAGRLIAGSGGALDIDVGCTAATNTLPIRRLALKPGERAEIDVLMLPAPDYSPRVVRQRYTRQGNRYLYENVESGFSALLEVDSEGWVLTYPGLCRRMEG